MVFSGIVPNLQDGNICSVGVDIFYCLKYGLFLEATKGNCKMHCIHLDICVIPMHLLFQAFSSTPSVV